LAQFTSAFLLLGCGVVLSCALLLCEHGYFAYVRPCFSNMGSSGRGFLSLISLNVAESLQKKQVRRKNALCRSLTLDHSLIYIARSRRRRSRCA